MDEMDIEVDELDNKVDESNNEVEKSNNEGDEMDASSEASDITTIKVHFLGEWHDIVIDWNDDRKYKQDQIFAQLEEMTGILSAFITFMGLYEMRPVNPRRRNGIKLFYIHNNDFHYVGVGSCPPNLIKEDVIDSCIEDGERFYLSYNLYFERFILRNAAISFMLVPEILVVEGRCNMHLCQTTHTEPFFNRVKDIILSEPLNDEMLERFEALGDPEGRFHSWYIAVKYIYQEYNILQFFEVACSNKLSPHNNEVFDDSDENIIEALEALDVN